MSMSSLKSGEVATLLNKRSVGGLRMAESMAANGTVEETAHGKACLHAIRKGLMDVGWAYTFLAFRIPWAPGIRKIIHFTFPSSVKFNRHYIFL